MIGWKPDFIIVDEVHNEERQRSQRILLIGGNSAGDYNTEDVDAYVEVMDRLRNCAFEVTMRDMRKAYQQKHGPRDRWGKCK